MIPEVAAVVAAAKAWAAIRPQGTDGTPLGVLYDAVEALEIRESRPAGAVTHEEQERTWGEVVAGDEILSVKTHKWYEVDRATVDDQTGNVKVNIKGSTKPIVRKSTDPVKVKRGKLGDGADLFQLLWSGQFRPEEVAATGIGPMMTEEETPDD